jgi:hypothetical protein
MVMKNPVRWRDEDKKKMDTMIELLVILDFIIFA